MSELRNTRDLRDERLREDAEFRAEWERTALARAVALRILGYRIEHHLTQTELSRRLGMRQSAIARLEMGEHNPTVDTMRKLADALGMEFLLHISPTDRPLRWSDPAAPTDAVVEQACSEHSRVLAMAG